MSATTEKSVEVCGRVFTATSLPEVPVRWTQHRKAEIAMCVIGQLLTYDQVQRRYGVSKEELVGWKKKIRIGDVGALRVKQIQRLPRDAREPALR